MQCQRCGAEIKGNFCFECGNPAPVPTMTCPECGRTFTGNFCPMCGTPANPYADGNYCLEMIVNYWDVQFAGRYGIFRKVLYEAQKYHDPLHLLACAYACHYSKVDYRKMAIEYFEKYLLDPVPCNVVNFPLYIIYSDLGENYESEYDFEKAEKCYKKSISLRTRHYYPNGLCDTYPQEIKLGRLYLKLGTQKALDYWETLMQYPEYKNSDPGKGGFRRSIDAEYRKAKEKHDKGYVYTPRKKAAKK